MKRAFVFASMSLWMFGCTCGVVVNPEGLRCGPQDPCPTGYDCVSFACHSNGMSGGGSGGSGGTGGTGGAGGTGGGAVGGGSGGSGGFGGGAVGGGSGGSGGAGGSGGGSTGLCTGVVCPATPPPACMGNSVRTYSAAMCIPTTGVCGAFPFVDAACATTCANGACVPPDRTWTQTSPRLNFVVRSVDFASDGGVGEEAYAVGDTGAAAYWNGSKWSTITTSTQNNFTSVWMTPTFGAIAVGEKSTAQRFSGTTATNITIPVGVGQVRFVSVDGLSDNTYTIAEETGLGLKRVNGAAFVQLSPSGALKPWKTRQVFVDALGHVRVAASCTNVGSGCVLYNDGTAGSNGWSEHYDNALGSTAYGAVGPSFDTLSVDSAFVGRAATNSVRRHLNPSQSIVFDNTSVPSLQPGGGVLAITGTQVIGGLGPRLLHVLVDRPNVGLASLQRATTTGTEVAMDLIWNTYSMSRNEVGSSVLVVDADSTAVNNDIVRRSGALSEALDVGDDWVAVAGNAGGSVAYFDDRGNVAAKSPLSSKYQYRRDILPSTAVSIRDGALVGGYGISVGDNGRIRRVPLTGLGPAQAITSSTAVNLNAVCRASDTEAFAVGNGGIIRAIASPNGGTATASVSMNANTKNLADVDCPSATQAVACGDTGTVLRFNGTAWTAIAVPPGGASVTIASCRFLGGAIYVAGDGLFAKFENNAWASLPGRTKLDNLVPVGVNEIYATSAGQLVRFNGTNWQPVTSANPPNGFLGGTLVNGKVVYAGPRGVVFEAP